MDSFRVTPASVANALTQKVRAKRNVPFARKWRGVVAEFIATAFFVYFACSSVTVPFNIFGGTDEASSVIVAALSQGLIITALVAVNGKISGGHINPAVTLCLMVIRNFDPWTGVAYMISQFLGGLVGAGLAKAVFGNLAQNLGSTVRTFPSVGQAFLMEFMITSMLMFTVLGTALHSDDDFKPLAPIPIGFAVTAGVLIAGLVTGGSMNPARSFGPAVVSHSYEIHWIYWIAPFLAAIVSGILYKLLFLSTPLSADELQGMGIKNPSITDGMGTGGTRGEVYITEAEAIDMRSGNMADDVTEINLDQASSLQPMTSRDPLNRV